MDLLENHHPDFKLFEAEIASLREKILRPEIREDQFHRKLDALRINIRSNKQIDALPVAAFLASGHPEIEKKQTAMIKAVVLVIAYHLGNLTGYDQVIIRAMREVRLMIERPNRELLKLLPDFSQHLKSLLADIKGARNAELKKDINRRMGCIQVLLADYLNNKPENKRKHTRQPRSTPTGRNYSARHQGSQEDDSYTYAEYFVSEQSDSAVDVNRQERQADQDSVSKYIAIKVIAPEAVVKSLTLQNQRAKQIANYIVKREKLLPADWSQLTDFEIETFLREAFAYLSDRSGVFLFLLMSLFTGRSLVELVSMPQYNKTKTRFGWRLTQGFLELVSRLKLPQHDVGQALEPLIRRSESELIISLPYVIGEAFFCLPLKPQNSCAIEEAAKVALADINRQHNTRLSLNRLRNYMRYALSRTGVDAVEINLLHGATSLQEAGAYYYQVNDEQLTRAYDNFCIRLLHKLGKDFEFQPTHSRHCRVGSQLQLLESKLALLFRTTRHEANRYRRQGNRSLAEFHNWYTIFILHLLNLSSGHRPVKNPFDSIDYFDLEAGTVFISDKEVRSELSARTLVLPPLAVTQVKEYLRHLTVLKNYFIDINPALYETVCCVEAGKMPLLFFIANEQIDFVAPALLEKRLASVLPLPLNWHRHFMRTKLRQLGVSGQQVDAWMGHAGFGGEAFSRFSGLAMQDLRNIAEAIEAFLTNQLEIAPLAAWSHKA